jgi:vacuolar-type H+-ATPase subunit E/Vma4
MKETASLDAARIVREAEGRAGLILQQAQAQLEDVQREIDGLRLKRRESEVALESIIAALNNTLEYVREQDQREHRIIPHRPLLNVAQSA